ncbi:MAG TPA: hypothetical protein DEF51_48400 [Myxococcales bacterium]|nr:hypothetical protein [Myxococcales bacterium]
MGRFVIWGLLAFGGCAQHHYAEARLDAGVELPALPQPCPFELDEPACSAREGCAYAFPGGAPTLAREGCVELRACGVRAECLTPYVCRDVGLDPCRSTGRPRGGCLDAVLRLPLCVPPDAYRVD